MLSSESKLTAGTLRGEDGSGIFAAAGRGAACVRPGFVAIWWSREAAPLHKGRVRRNTRQSEPIGNAKDKPRSRPHRWPAIEVLPGEILVTGQDAHEGSASRCDTFILNATRPIKNVLVAGYDTNKCVIDKPCGAVTLSKALEGVAELVLVRDATLGEYGWFGNEWHAPARKYAFHSSTSVDTSSRAF